MILKYFLTLAKKIVAFQHINCNILKYNCQTLTEIIEVKRPKGLSFSLLKRIRFCDIPSAQQINIDIVEEAILMPTGCFQRAVGPRRRLGRNNAPFEMKRLITDTYLRHLMLYKSKRYNENFGFALYYQPIKPILFVMLILKLFIKPIFFDYSVRRIVSSILGSSH